MICDPIDWRYVAPHEFVLWFRRPTKRSYWRIFGIANSSTCRDMAVGMALRYPKRSIVVLPKYETPVLETAQ